MSRSDTAHNSFYRITGKNRGAEIIQADVKTFINSPNLKPATKLRYLWYIKNAGANIEIPAITVKNKKITYLTKTQIDPFVSYFKSQYIKDWVVVSIYTGMRRGEVASLTLDEIDFENGLISKHETRTKNGESRTIPMTPTVAKVLRKYFKDCTSETFEQMTIDRKSFSVAVTRAAKKLGINISVHGLRHTFATLLLTSGVDIYTVKTILGHKDIQTTMRYFHVTQAQQTQVIDSLEAVA